MTKPKLSKFDRQRIWEIEQRKLPGVFMPIVTVSEMNVRDHWAVRNKRTSISRSTTNLLLRNQAVSFTLPANVTLTRYGKKILDDDNLRSALKACRDGVADAFNVDDAATSGLTFSYAQELSPFCGVRVVIAPAESVGAK